MNLLYRINIIDSVIKMAEKYSLNLEEIIEERTNTFVEEQKKTDILLYKMLPAYVKVFIICQYFIQFVLYCI